MKKCLLSLSLAFAGSMLLAQSGGTTGAPDSEKFRPRVHFSPATGWMSDPNGMVYHDGEYHLCYQHIPFNDPARIPWGEMYWGHATSRDLLHWTHQSVALAPDSLGYIFSGSAVADLHNTSGLGTPGNPPLLAVFTYYDHVAAKEKRDTETQAQGLAYSTDHGRTWIKYAGNPILKSPGLVDFRDPKVIWHEPSRRWVMAVACGKAIRFYGSPNCIDWNYLSEFGEGRGSHIGPWECPDLFPLRVAGTKQTKWVLLVSLYDSRERPSKYETKTQYFIGDFDGRQFTSLQQDTLWTDYGRDNYAGLTFDNAPDNRRIFMGWMHSHQYAGGAMGSTTGGVWSGAGTFPREFGIVCGKDAYRLTSAPVHEIERLHGRRTVLKNLTVDKTLDLSGRIPFAKFPLDLSLTFELPGKGGAQTYGLRLRNDRGEYISMEYDASRECYRVDRTHAVTARFSDPFDSVREAPYKPADNRDHWRLIIDRASVELFAGENKIVFTHIFFPDEPFDTIELYSTEGTVTLKKGTATELKSIRFDSEK